MSRQYISLAWFFLLTLTLVSCQQPTTAPPIATPQEKLVIEAPESAVVGDTVELLVGPHTIPDGTPVFLSLLGGYGPNLLRAEFDDGMAWFQIPSSMTTVSGLVTAVVSSGTSQGETTILFVPDQPVEPIIPLVGERSIIADGDHWAMVVAIPFDQYGNPVAEGTPVDIRSLHPGNNLRTYQSDVEHLLVWEKIYSGIKAGRTVIATNIDDVHGPEGVLLEIPGWPIPFSLSADPPSLPADGFQLMTLKSSIIVDKHDNVMPDGTQVTFIVTGVSGETWALPTITIDGIAETIMQAPDVAGDYTIQAAVFGVKSEVLVARFSPGPAVEAFPIDVLIHHKNEELVLQAGPITANLDQYVADGTSIKFVIVDPDGEEITRTAVSDAGYASVALRLASLSQGLYDVSAFVGTGEGHTKFVMPE